VEDSGDTESAKSFCINRKIQSKKKEKKKNFLQLGEIVLRIEHSIVLFYFFFQFLHIIFFPLLPNVFLNSMK